MAPSIAEKLEHAAAKASTALAVGGLVALMALAAMTLADGLARWLFNQPIQGVRDVASLVIAIAISSCIPSCLAERSNITIRLVQKWSPRTARVFEALASTLVAIVIAAMAWQFFHYAVTTSAAGETTWVLGLPTAPFWWLVDALLWCSVLVQSVVAFSAIGHLFPLQNMEKQA